MPEIDLSWLKGVVAENFAFGDSTKNKAPRYRAPTPQSDDGEIQRTAYQNPQDPALQGGADSSQRPERDGEGGRGYWDAADQESDSQPPPRRARSRSRDDGDPDQGLLKPTQIVARVGTDAILAGDVVGLVEPPLYEKLKKVPPEQRDHVRMDAMLKQMQDLIRVKVILADIEKSIPKEGFDKQMEKLREIFHKEVVPTLIAQYKVGSRRELEELFRSRGSSMEIFERHFCDLQFTQMWSQRSVEIKEEVSQDQILQYWHDFPDEFRVDARVTWEHLMARMSDYETADDARAAIADMGNEVLDGESLANVARRRCRGTLAKNAGQEEPTRQGVLNSTGLDEAIFSLPVGKLSQIIEDEGGFHIVRVLSRQEAGFVPFEEAQDSIRQKIIAERRRKAMQDYVNKLTKNTTITTIFDNPDDIIRSAKAFGIKNLR